MLLISWGGHVKRTHLIGFLVAAGCMGSIDRTEDQNNGPGSELGSETAYSTPETCPTDLLVSGVTANECCYDGTQTMFMPDTYLKVVTRTKNPYGTACKASPSIIILM